VRLSRDKFNWYYEIHDKKNNNVYFPVVPFTAADVEFKPDRIVIIWRDGKVNIIKLNDFIMVVIKPTTTRTQEEFSAVHAGSY
jgi:hypothetical protein